VRDKSGDAKLEADGFRIVRVWNNEIDRTWKVCSIEYLTSSGQVVPPPRHRKRDAGPPHEGEVRLTVIVSR
jgi:hypothetical protein